MFARTCSFKIQATVVISVVLKTMADVYVANLLIPKLSFFRFLKKKSLLDLALARMFLRVGRLY